MAEKIRDPYFDLIKLVAIFMVVFSHVQSYRPGFSFADMPSRSLNFIMVVNMPLFFMISGYFSRKLHESSNGIKLVDRLISYFWPMAFFAAFSALVDCFVFHKYLATDVPIWLAKKFLLGGWFFWALASCEVITFCAYKYSKSCFSTLLIGVVAYFGCLCVGDRVPHVPNIVAMIPFYWFGLLVLPSLLPRMMLFSTIAAIGAVAMLWATYFAGNIATNGLSFYWDRFDVWHPEGVKAVNMILRYLIGIGGGVCVMVVVKIFMRTLPAMRHLASIGKETLGIYFLQGYMIHWISNKFVKLDADVGIMLLAACFVLLLSFGIVKISKQSGFTKQLLWGMRLSEFLAVQNRRVSV